MQRAYTALSTTLAGFGWGPVGEDATAAAAFRALFRLKGLVRDRRCAAVVTVPAGRVFSRRPEFIQVCQHQVLPTGAAEHVTSCDITMKAPAQR